MAIAGALLALAFVALQGAAIFATAYLAARLLKSSHWFTKCCVMAVSYATWIAVTLIGYSMLGGEGGLMDGFGLMLSLCFTALVSSVIFTTGWLAAPLFQRAVNG